MKAYLIERTNALIDRFNAGDQIMELRGQIRELLALVKHLESDV